MLESFKELPNVYCNLTYSDIGEKQYTKRFQVFLGISLDAFENSIDLKTPEPLRLKLGAEAKTCN